MNVLKGLQVWRERRSDAQTFRQVMWILGVPLDDLSNQQIIDLIAEGTFIREVERILGEQISDPTAEMFQQQAETFYDKWTMQ